MLPTKFFDDLIQFKYILTVPVDHTLLADQETQRIPTNEEGYMRLPKFMTIHGLWARKRRPRGFSLLEMMIVITVILILAGIAATRYERSILRAKEATLKQDLFVMRNAIQQYTLDKMAGPTWWGQNTLPAFRPTPSLAPRIGTPTLTRSCSTRSRLLLVSPTFTLTRMPSRRLRTPLTIPGK